MADNIYSSNQYQMLMDLSAMMTGVVWQLPFQSAVSTSLTTKLNRLDEMVFLTDPASSTYSQNISKAGINIVTTDMNKPTVMLEYIYSSEYTFDKLSSIIINLDTIKNAKEYIKHYTSGTLPSLTIKCNKELIDTTILGNVIEDHNNYINAHSNIDNLLNYYNKTNIDQQINTIDEKINKVKSDLNITINNKYQDSINYTNKCKEEIQKKINNTYSYNLQNYWTIDQHNSFVNVNSSEHTNLQNNINIVSNELVKFQKDHENSQLNLHKDLLPKTNPIAQNNLNINSQYGNIKLTVYADYAAIQTSYSIPIKATNNGNEMTILSTDGYTYVNTPPGADNTKKAATTEWVKQYLDNYFQYSPYDSMPDYAYATTMFYFSRNPAVYGKIYKINVPGYIYFNTTHCPDSDIVMLASYKPQYLLDPATYKNQIIMLNQAFGQDDYTQSTFMHPIYPGSTTYVLLQRNGSIGDRFDQNSFIFIPALGVRRKTIDTQKYYTYYSNKTYKHHDINTNPTSELYNKIFNTKENPKIWETNF